MYDRCRLNRLIALGLSSCAVTWGFAAAAQARPEASQAAGATAATAAPAFHAVAGDTNKAPAATAAPAFHAVAGDTDKAPGAAGAPAFQPAPGDAAKSPDPRQVDRVLNGLAARGTAPVGAPAATTNDDTGTIALIVAIAAMLVALGAVTLMMTRAPRPVLRA
jgi:hypothetical protein